MTQTRVHSPGGDDRARGREDVGERGRLVKQLDLILKTKKTRLIAQSVRPGRRLLLRHAHHVPGSGAGDGAVSEASFRARGKMPATASGRAPRVVGETTGARPNLGGFFFRGEAMTNF
tara:strand:+ start:162 stop:515 length:354 start_codon:yes stop_codon:yes gene_type:complete